MSLGLALGAGLGSGVAQIGVLMALHRRGGPSGAVAGTAIGAFAAVCQAADRLDVLEDIARSARLRTVLRYLDPHFRRGAMLGGRTIARQLDRHLGPASFEQLALPCAVVAAALVTGDAVVLHTGNVAEDGRASLAPPGLFHPAL